MNKTKTMTLAIVAMIVMLLATVATAQVRTITLSQNYTGAPGNMVVETDAQGNLTGPMNAPRVLPSPTRTGFDFRGWFTTAAATGGTRVISGAYGTQFTTNTTIYARWTAKTVRTISNIPALEKDHFDWVKNTRNVCEGPVMRASTNNLIFHQIFAGNGSFNWAVRWESTDTVSLQERRRIAAMLYDGINDWLRPLMGYEDWPFGEIPVNVVGWAVQDGSLIRDRQPNETIWVNSDTLEPKSGYVTGDMASAPRERSRFINRTAINSAPGGPSNYNWPTSIGGINGRYDHYLWLTKKKNNGVQGACGSAEGGDWGFRWGQCLPGSGGSGTSAANSHATSGTINGVMLHEIGHAFGFYDWYGGPCCGCTQRNPPGYVSRTTIMDATYNTNVSGNPSLNQYDQWQIRYYWSWIKQINTQANLWNYTPVPWVVAGSSSSSSGSSSSSAVTVTCNLPNSLVAGATVNNATQRSYLRCSNTNAAPTQGNNPTWTGTPRAPISGTAVAAAGNYTNIGVSVNCGAAVGVISGTCSNITITAPSSSSTTPSSSSTTPSSSSDDASSSSSTDDGTSSSSEGTTGISVVMSGVQSFNLNSRGVFSYNLGETRSANLKIFDYRGRLLKTIPLNGTHGIVDTQLGSSTRALLWRVEDNGRLISQSKRVIW